LDEEACRAGELVGLLWRDLDVEGLVGQVSPGEFVGIGYLGLVLVQLPRGLVLVPGSQPACFEALAAEREG
jgi:hypothetical protein